MNKTYVSYVAVVLLVAVGVWYALAGDMSQEGQVYAASDYMDAEYVIDGERVRLENGFAESSIPDSSLTVVTRHFGNELVTDLNSDGRDDVVFLLTQEAGGSGTFFYVVAALNTIDGYVGSDAYLLGDRIAPQTTEVSRNPRHVNVIVVNYTDRAPGEPMTTQPSMGKSAYLKLVPEAMQWAVVEPNFEGEADPSQMTLEMKKWEWVSALYNDGREVEPNVPGQFTLTFFGDGRFSAATDCNSMSGGYVTEGGAITFSDIAMTKMFCQDSQENEFLLLLRDTSGYHFTSYGELILDLKFDSGSVVFR